MIRAIGATRVQVRRAIVLEAAFLGLCAAVGGVLSGMVQCVLFLETLVVSRSGWHLDFVFPLEATLRIAALVMLTGAIAGFLPGMRAARLEVKEALAYE